MPYDELHRALERIARFQPSEEACIASKVLEEEHSDELKLASSSVLDYEFSVRAQNVMHFAGIVVLGQLTRKTETDILRYRNCGVKTLNEIKRKLEILGLKLQDYKTPADSSFQLKPSMDWEAIDKIINWNAPLARQAKRLGIDPGILGERRRKLGITRTPMDLSTVDWSKSDDDLECETGFTSAMYTRWRVYAAWDWERRDTDLSLEHSISRERVRQIRARLGRAKVTAWSVENHPAYDTFSKFTPEDWQAFNVEIAAKYSVAVKDVIRMRKIFAPGTFGKSFLLREIEKIGWGSRNRDIVAAMAAKGIRISANHVSAFRQRCAPNTVTDRNKILRLDPDKWDWNMSDGKVADEHRISPASAAIWRRRLKIKPYRRNFFDWSKVDWSKHNRVLESELKFAKATIAFRRKLYAPDTIRKHVRSSMYAWETVDWSKSNYEISKIFGCSYWAVYFNRKKYAPDTARHSRGIYNWSKVDWSKANSQIILELGCDKSTVYAARKKYAA